jgi:hypothetical protein
VPEVNRCDATSKQSCADNSARRFGPHRSRAEYGTADRRKAEKLLHAIEVLIATLSDRWEILYRDQARAQRLQPGGSLLWSCNWGWLVIAISPAEPYHPGTAVADHRDIEEAATRVLDACR